MTENADLLEQSRAELVKPTAKAFFERQGVNEKLNAANKLGGAPDFGMVFNQTLFQFLRIVGRENVLPRFSVPSAEGTLGQRTVALRQQLRQRTDVFMDDLRQIEMEDTIYPEVQTGMPDLMRNVDGVLVWTTGHPNYQLAKIESSKIEDLLEDAQSTSGRQVALPSLVSRNKEVDTLGVLENFAQAHPDGEITVVIYDDSQGNFAKADKVIEKFEKETGRTVRRFFVWAQTGRAGENMSPEKAQEAISKLPTSVSENLQTARSFTEFIHIVEEHRSTSTGPILTLLDFDGALSDNRIMRMRQSQVFHDHLRKIIQEVSLPEGTREEIEAMEARIGDLLKEAKS